jgi:hypothetical protein
MNEWIDFYIFRATDTQKQVYHQQIARIPKYEYKRDSMFRVLFIAIFREYQNLRT